MFSISEMVYLSANIITLFYEGTYDGSAEGFNTHNSYYINNIDIEFGLQKLIFTPFGNVYERFKELRWVWWVRLTNTPQPRKCVFFLWKANGWQL